MPLPTTLCPADDDPCCTEVFTMASRILDIVYADLVGCLWTPDPDCGPSLTKYVTMSPGDDGVADSLAVTFLGAASSGGSIDPRGRMGAITLSQGSFEVRLRESGWPLLTTVGGVLGAPDPALQELVTKHSVAHGEKMYRILRSLVQRRFYIFHPDLPPITFGTLGPLRPVPPQGGIVGWSATITADLPWSINAGP